MADGAVVTGLALDLAAWWLLIVALVTGALALLAHVTEEER